MNKESLCTLYHTHTHTHTHTQWRGGTEAASVHTLSREHTLSLAAWPKWTRHMRAYSFAHSNQAEKARRQCARGSKHSTRTSASARTQSHTVRLISVICVSSTCLTSAESRRNTPRALTQLLTRHSRSRNRQSMLTNTRSSDACVCVCVCVCVACV